MGILAILGITLGLAATLMAATDGAFGDKPANAVDSFLGLDSDTGDAVWKTQMQNNNLQSQEQRDWSEKMYYEDRAWQSPSNQMRLYREAGLNPSLMYGQPIQTGQLGAGAEGSYSGSPVSQLGSLLGLGSDVAMMPAQVDLMRAQAEEIRSRIPVNQQKINESKARIFDIMASVEERKQKVQLMLSQQNLTDAQRENISFEQSLKSQYLTMDLKKLDIYSNLSDAEIAKKQAETNEILSRAAINERELQEMIWTYAIRKAGLEKQNLLIDAQIRQAEATADKLRKEGVRFDQLINMDANKESTKQAIYNAAHSKNKIESFGGCLMMAIDYAADNLLGKLVK